MTNKEIIKNMMLLFMILSSLRLIAVGRAMCFLYPGSAILQQVARAERCCKRPDHRWLLLFPLPAGTRYPIPGSGHTARRKSHPRFQQDAFAHFIFRDV